ncbi:MAG: hypothetical protein QTN59_13580 [Candidatus Electrothrix communis]|nr:MAG: hypothetical protein QTN59_13580 [Candidatus Electrothrix communis]
MRSKLLFVLTGVSCLAIVPDLYASVVENLRVSKECRRDQSTCSAEDKANIEIKKICHNRPGLCDNKKSRLTTYQPNYAIFQSTDDDEGSLEAHYSFKYLFGKRHCMPLKPLDDINGGGGDAENEKKKSKRDVLGCLKDYRDRGELFLKYTGEFDFYAGSRESGPVINRISNPGFHYRDNFENLSFANISMQWVTWGLEHRSNGQVIEADLKVMETSSPDFGKYKAQVELDDENHEYFDAISRGANYFSVEGKFNIGEHGDNYEKCKESFSCINLWVSGKLYINEDSDVYWGDLANTGVKINDYDRVNIVVSDTFHTNSSFPEIEVGLKWTVGDELLETDSYDINLSFPWIPSDDLKIPFYIKAHFGPMNTLSNYTKDQSSIGFGIKLR